MSSLESAKVKQLETQVVDFSLFLAFFSQILSPRTRPR